MRIGPVCYLIFFDLPIIFSVGRREPCSNEGEEVAVDAIKDMTCYKCICQVSVLIFNSFGLGVHYNGRSFDLVLLLLKILFLSMLTVLYWMNLESCFWPHYSVAQKKV